MIENMIPNSAPRYVLVSSLNERQPPRVITRELPTTITWACSCPDDEGLDYSTHL